MTIFSKIENIRESRGCAAFALIAPDSKNDIDLIKMVNLINSCDFDAILVGGSLIMDHHFEERINTISNNTELPVIIFPGSSRQLSAAADAVLYLSLLSGRNPQYLIGEQVESAPIIYSLGIEPISTGYILLDGGSQTSVQIMSNTNPLPMVKRDIVLAHALAAQFLGKQLLFFECGSGSSNHAHSELVSYITSHVKIPLMIGGGVNSAGSAGDLSLAGAGYIVIGTKIETGATNHELMEITSAIHTS